MVVLGGSDFVFCSCMIHLFLPWMVLQYGCPGADWYNIGLEVQFGELLMPCHAARIRISPMLGASGASVGSGGTMVQWYMLGASGCKWVLVGASDSSGG